MKREVRGRPAVLLLATSLILAFTLSTSASAAGADVTKAASPNGPLTKLTITTPGGNGLVTFTGIVNQVVSVATSAGTFVDNCDVNVSIVKPDGVTTLAGPVCGGQAGTITGVTIPKSGTYTVLVDPVADDVGTVKVAITSTGSIRSITPGAPYLTGTVPANGVLNLKFVGGAGKSLFVRTADGNFSSDCDLELTVQKPDSSQLAYQPCMGATGTTNYLDETAMPVGGTYTFAFHNQTSASHKVKIQMWVYNDLTGSIAYGAAKTTSIKKPGQRAIYTLAGTNGDRVTAAFTASTFTSGWLYFNRPNGSEFAYEYFDSNDRFNDPIVLDATGSWKVIVDPDSDYTGTITTKLATVTDLTGTISYGTAKTTTITQPGQRAIYTLAGTSGQKVTTNVTSSTITSGWLYFIRPDGTELTYVYFDTTPRVSDPITLDASGSWKVIVDPDSDYTGTLKFKLTTS